MSDIKKLLSIVENGILPENQIDLHDSFDIELNKHFIIETGVVGFTDDGIIIEADETLLGLLEVHNLLESSPGLWANIHAKRKRIKSGSGEHMRKPGSKGAPTTQNFKDAAKESIGEGYCDACDRVESQCVCDKDKVYENFPGSNGEWIHGGFRITYDPTTMTVRVHNNKQEKKYTFKKQPNLDMYKRMIGNMIDQLEAESDVYEDNSSDLEQDLNDFRKRAGLPQSTTTQTQQPTQQPTVKRTKLDQMNPLDREQWEKEKEQAGIKNEAEYQGHEVPLNKPMQGDVKKSKVYVKNASGNVVKVNFGDPNMTIKKSNPDRRRSFRARHHCENPGPKWKARYWSCKAW